MFNNISFIGMAGCGKSTIGKALSSKLSLSFVDTDLLIEARFNQSLESIKKSNGYEFVRMVEEEAILGLEKSTKIISTGGSAIYSEKSMRHLDAFTNIIYICTPLNLIKERILEDQERGLAVPDGMSIEDIFKERESLYEKWAKQTIDGRLSVDTLVKTIVSLSNG
ncbi:shikimate kinase [Gammaproteobacteria bacterium]|nr:shikimate kinase [Gammaproteobacteria bacterium]